MKIAKPTDWRAEPLPLKRTSISLNRSFSAEEMEIICRGIVPEEIEDRWFVYWQNHRLFFHRSWTGFCVFIVHFKEENGCYRMVDAEVNRDRNQYKNIDDEKDRKYISSLIDAILAHRMTTRDIIG